MITVSDYSTEEVPMKYFYSRQGNRGAIAEYLYEHISICSDPSSVWLFKPTQHGSNCSLCICNNGLNSENPLERDVPICNENLDAALIKRCIASLTFEQINKIKQSKCICSCPLNYVLVRERSVVLVTMNITM